MLYISGMDAVQALVNKHANEITTELMNIHNIKGIKKGFRVSPEFGFSQYSYDFFLKEEQSVKIKQ